MVNSDAGGEINNQFLLVLIQFFYISFFLLAHLPFLEPFFQFCIKHTRAAVLTKTIRDSMLHLVQARRQQESKVNNRMKSMQCWIKFIVHKH